jgi:cytochrome c peroxidase
MKFVLRFATLVAVACCGLPVASAAEKVKLPDDSLTAGIPGKGPVTLAEIEKWLANAKNHEPLEVELPLGLDVGKGQMQGLKENPLTRAKIELGRQLYVDTRLSADNTVSCASCHHPDEGYSRNTKTGVGIRDQRGGRNSPICYNRIFSSVQFWDGRAATLEEQAKGPIANPIEMGNTHEAAVATLKKIPGYVKQFEKIYPDGVTIDNVAKSIAAFERTLVTGSSPYDYAERFKRFEKLPADDLEELKEDEPEVYAEYEHLQKMTKAEPMTAAAKRGQALFFSQRINCAACHVGANLADELYHNLGVGADAKEPDVGRFAVTKDPKDWGAFKTPTIRNVEFSGPYMHDGSLATLEEVVEHYNKGGTPNKNLSDKIVKLNLNPQEKADLVAFMKACSGPLPHVEQGRVPADK